MYDFEVPYLYNLLVLINSSPTPGSSTESRVGIGDWLYSVYEYLYPVQMPPRSAEIKIWSNLYIKINLLCHVPKHT